MRFDEVAGTTPYYKENGGNKEGNRKRGHLGELEREPRGRDNEHQCEYNTRKERVARPLNET